MARPTKAIMMPRTPKVMVRVGGSCGVVGDVLGMRIGTGVAAKWGAKVEVEVVLSMETASG